MLPSYVLSEEAPVWGLPHINKFDKKRIKVGSNGMSIVI